jgi:2-keto-4-pentenoate hydratase/2-oxohepta-3-ene-1,7-dioic acid hydratase in catechol pathway
LKLVRFIYNKGESFGVMTNFTELIDLQKLSKIKERSTLTSMDRLVAVGQDSSNKVEDLFNDSTQKDKRKATLKLSKVKVLAPVLSPPKIICLGLNYRDHAAEQKASLPDEPIIFMKPHTAIIGPDDAIVKPSFVKQLDYEAELAVVIGKKGRNIAVEGAGKHIFGYTCFNDVSARDIQFKDKQWTRGKSFDTFAPMGPSIATTDQIGDPTNLRVRAWVNGELRQDGSTSNMVFNVYQIVHELSRVMTLEPCDVIATGTPAGVGFAMQPEPKFLKDGDIVEIEVEKIGRLRNKVVN